MWSNLNFQPISWVTAILLIPPVNCKILKKRKQFVNKFRRPQISLFEVYYNFSSFLYTLFLTKNYSHFVLVKIVKGVIFLRITYFFQKINNTFKKSHNSPLHTVTSVVDALTFIQLIRRFNISDFITYFSLFYIPSLTFWEKSLF